MTVSFLHIATFSIILIIQGRFLVSYRVHGCDLYNLHNNGSIYDVRDLL